MSERGRLLVCATPIGNLGDVSDRLREALTTADVVYAEDTRRTATLLQHVGATPTVRSLFAARETARTDELMARLDEGRIVALVSDAGMPGISDPGAEAVRRARDAGHEVIVIPGPSAVTTAVAAAGFGGDRFVFEGFLPRKGAARAVRLAALAHEDRPAVIFVSPHRLLADLRDLAVHTGSDRSVAITRELTKLHEEVWVGQIGAAIERWEAREVKGEFTVVVAPGIQEPFPLDVAIAEARELLSGGASPSEAARRISAATGVSRRSVYEALIRDQERS